MHIYNRVVDSNAERKNALKVDNGHYYKWKEGNIFYTKTGTGKPILLIHDTDSGASGEEWAKVRLKSLQRTIPYTLLICLDDWPLGQAFHPIYKLHVCTDYHSFCK